MARKLRKEGRHFHAFMTTAWFFMSRSMDKSCLPLFKMTRSILAERDEAAQFDSRTVSRRAQTCFCLDSDNLALFEDFVDPLDLRGDLPGVARAYVGLHDKRDSRRSLGDDVDASLDHRHDLVPFAFECGEHGRGFVRQARLADRLDRGRNRLGHGAVGLIGRHRRNGKCKQHRARLAPASAEARLRRGLGVDAPRRAAGVSFQSSAIGVAPRSVSLRNRRRSANGFHPLQVSVSDRYPSAIGVVQAYFIEQKIDNLFF